MLLERVCSAWAAGELFIAAGGGGGGGGGGWHGAKDQVRALTRNEEDDDDDDDDGGVESSRPALCLLLPFSFGVRQGTLPDLEGWLAAIGVPPSKVAVVLKGLPSGLTTRLSRPGWESFLQSKLAALGRLGLGEHDCVRAIVAYPNVLALK